MRVSASLHAADPLRLSEAVEAVAPHVGSLRIDIMDGRFASAFGFSEALVRSLVTESIITKGALTNFNIPEMQNTFPDLVKTPTISLLECIIKPKICVLSLNAEPLPR